VCDDIWKKKRRYSNTNSNKKTEKSIGSMVALWLYSISHYFPTLLQLKKIPHLSYGNMPNTALPPHLLGIIKLSTPSLRNVTTFM